MYGSGANAYFHFSPAAAAHCGRLGCNEGHPKEDCWDSTAETILTTGHSLLRFLPAWMPWGGDPDSLHFRQPNWKSLLLLPRSWHIVNQLQLELWEKWNYYYLHNLQARRKWKDILPYLQVGDFVSSASLDN